MELPPIEAEKVLDRPQVFEVLMERVLELGLSPVDHLRPSALIGASKDPALHVLGFDDEHAVGRHDKMVDLGSSAARGQGQVVEHPKTDGIKASRQCVPDSKLAKCAFEPRRAEYPDNDDEDNDADSYVHCDGAPMLLSLAALKAASLILPVIQVQTFEGIWI